MVRACMRPAYAGPVFTLGQVVITPGAVELGYKTETDILLLLARHSMGDWGTIDVLDRQVNESALKSGSRLMSEYIIGNDQRIWIITDADRSVTTILIPSEY